MHTDAEPSAKPYKPLDTEDVDIAPFSCKTNIGNPRAHYMDRQRALIAFSVERIVQRALLRTSVPSLGTQQLLHRLSQKSADGDSLRSELAQQGLDLNINQFIDQWIDRFAEMYAVLNYDCRLSIEEAEGKMRQMLFILFSHIHSVAEKEGVSPLNVWERVEQGEIVIQSFSQRDAGEVYVTQTSYVPESGTEEGLPSPHRVTVGSRLGSDAINIWKHCTEQEQASANAVPA